MPHSVEEEIEILIREIKRLASPSTPDQVTFGVLVRDDEVANILEALVGTLRAAKKRNRVTYTGEMLLMGMSDDVVVKIVS